MRVSLPATLLSLVMLFVYLASPAVAGMPMSSCAAGGCEVSDEVGPTCEGEGIGCEQRAAPAGIFGGLCALDGCAPRWSFTAEAIALQRTTTRPQTLLAPLDTQDIDIVDASSLEFPVALGYQLSAIRHDILGCGWDLELAYFQVDGFDARAHMPGPSFIVMDVNQWGAIVYDAEVQYRSALYNGELNLRHCATDWLTLLVGVRMVELDEHFSAGGTALDGEQSATAAAAPSLLAINTYNHLFGVQLGAEAEVYNMGGPLQIKASCKAGVFDNAAFENYRSRDMYFTDSEFGAQRDQAAFLGEAGVVATYALTQRLAFRASATAMWISGVALAPEQIQSVDLMSGASTIDTFGTVFYYGGGLGLEYRF